MIVFDNILPCPLSLDADIGGAIAEGTIQPFAMHKIRLGKELRAMKVLQVVRLVDRGQFCREGILGWEVDQIKLMGFDIAV